MKEVIYSMFAVILFLAIIGFLVWGLFDAASDAQVDIYAYEELMKPCEHEFVMSSRYNWFFKQYQIVSKCIKCGKVI